MHNDLYRRMFFEANALSPKSIANPMGSDWPLNWLLESMELQFGSRVLYAGCGTGRLIPHLKKRLGLRGQLIAIDESAQALSRVPFNDARWATLIQSGMEKIPVIDNSLDAIICHSSLNRVRNLAKVAAEFYRVLKPSGRAFITYLPPSTAADPSPPCPYGLNTIFIQAGFNRVDFDDDINLFFFAASKVAPYSFSEAASA